MNCISGTTRRAIRRRLPVLLLVSLMIACNGPATETAVARDTNEYDLRYTVTLNPQDASADVELRVDQARGLLREVRFKVGDDERYGSFRGDGEIEADGEYVSWAPPDSGGSIAWNVRIDNRRRAGGYDARLDVDWGLFRAEDVIPRAGSRSSEGAVGRTVLIFELPASWSVETQYDGENGVFPVPNEGRRFKQPTGWIVTGRLGIRRDQIAGVEVAVAGPVENGVRRMDMLALLNWTLPELDRFVPDMPTRITIFSAGDPMWRGGLSAPQSLYMHAERPLISENGTSTLIHEVMHIVLGFRGADGYDWIVEGLAEYYGVELLRRSGTLSAMRHGLTMAQLAEWSRQADTLCDDRSSGAETALAVGVFASLDKEIREASGGQSSLDDVVAELIAADQDVDLAALSEHSAALIGKNPDALHIDKLPGCRKIAAADAEP